MELITKGTLCPLTTSHQNETVSWRHIIPLYIKRKIPEMPLIKETTPVALQLMPQKGALEFDRLPHPQQFIEKVIYVIF